jgi:hypothetical protein
MEAVVKSPDYIRILDAAEFFIRRKSALADATPFLAHCELQHADRTRFATAFKVFIHRDADRIPEALRRWPLVSVWNIAAALSEDYGEDGHAVYAVLERAFGVDLTGNVRNSISHSFRSVCRKHGLCFEGSGRLVNDYLAQAGIANSQLHHVAKAFLLAERAFGLPPYENTAALNSWEDDAVHFLPVGVHIPRMVLEVDQSAHYASLFARYRLQESSRNEFEKRFFDEIGKAQNEIVGGRHHGQAVPRPLLLWSNSGLGLALPKVEGRLSVSVNGETRKLRGGQNWPLPTPWPAYVDWSVGDHVERLPVFPSDRHVLAFDSDLGRLVGQIDTTRETTLAVDAREVMLVAQCQFTVDGEPAFEIGLSGHAAHCQLGQTGATFTIESRTVQVTAKPKPRIWVESGVVAKGPKGFLLSGRSSLGVEFGELESESFDLALAIDGREEIISLTASPDAGAAIHDLSTEGIDGARVVTVRAELRLRGSNRALVRYKAWLWAGLREFRDGLVFDSDRRPANYAPEYSRHVIVDQSGRLCLDVDAAYDAATLSFRVDKERVDFEIVRPGITLSFTDPDGRSVPLKLGDTLVVGDDEKAGSLSVRCPDINARLNVRGRLEAGAFKRSTTRVLSLADLMSPAPRDDITVERSAAGSIPILLARIVPASAPTAFKIERKLDSLSLGCELPIDIDAIRFSLEDETGRRAEYDCALRHFPVPNLTPSWLRATLDFENTKRVLATIDLNEFHGEFSLAGLAVRPNGTESFRPLRNLRADNYAIAINPRAGTLQSTGESNVSRRFVTLNSWMGQCFAQQSWDQIGPPLMKRWMDTGKQIAEIPEERSLLLASAHLPRQPGTAKSWVPLSHPLQIIPSLYASPVTCFRSLAVNVSEGSEELAVLAETAGRSIPEIHQALGLSPAFLMAFVNFDEAHRRNRPLRGFDFNRYRQLFQTFDTDPAARWFWQSGSEILGPAHYGAALGRLIDRFYDAGLEEEGSNDARIRAANSVAHAASRLQERTLPPPIGIELTHGIFEFAPAFISGFAHASRHDAAADYLNRLAVRLERPHRAIIADASFLIRLAPELFAFYLLLWELSSERQLT